MATPITTVMDYCSALARSQLVSEEEIRQIQQQWHKDHSGKNGDVDGFARFLVKEKFLTNYQAALILRGRADGFIIHEYVILDRIGSGQTAGVYKAIHKSGQVVALKVLAGSKARDQHLLNRFLREGRLLTQLDHANVVRAYQVAQHGSVWFIVMEYLEGETLDTILDQRQKLPYTEAVRIVIQALNGLQHLHERRMVHRDLKPANLMVCTEKNSHRDNTLESTVKILDIGLGRELFDDDAPSTRDLQLTGEGALLGTPDYCSPEQARDARNTDIRGDIYSLGCVLYHMIAGHPPFQDRNVMAVMIQHATGKFKPIREISTDVPPGLAQVLDRMLEKSPDNRPATPSEAAALLKPFLPSNAKTAVKVDVLPAYQEWLESESALEMPAELKAIVQAEKPSQSIKGKSTGIPSAAVKPTTAKKFASKSAPVVTVSSPATAVVEEINVELVDLSQLSPQIVTAPPTLEIEEKSAFDFSRRDFVMLGLGAMGVLLAIGSGYGLARLTRKKQEPEEKAEE